jgi:uncharacterized protein YqiB (DUF1249 family)
MLTRVRHVDELLPGRFASLMNLYDDNYWRLSRMFGAERLVVGRYCSTAHDGLDVDLVVLERARYTAEIKLSYGFLDGATGQPEPSAHIRLYADARAAEVTACYFGSRLEHVLGAHAALSEIVDHRLRMNAFLNKWLDYLESLGHNRFGLQAVVAVA